MLELNFWDVLTEGSVTGFSSVEDTIFRTSHIRDTSFRDTDANLFFWQELTESTVTGFVIDHDLVFRTLSGNVNSPQYFLVVNGLETNQRQSLIGGVGVIPFTVYRHLLSVQRKSRQRVIHLSKVAPNVATIVSDLQVANASPNFSVTGWNYQSQDGFLNIQGLDIDSDFMIPIPASMSGSIISGGGTYPYGLFINPADEEKIILSTFDQQYAPLV